MVPVTRVSAYGVADRRLNPYVLDESLCRVMVPRRKALVEQRLQPVGDHVGGMPEVPPAPLQTPRFPMISELGRADPLPAALAGGRLGLTEQEYRDGGTECYDAQWAESVDHLERALEEDLPRCLLRRKPAGFLQRAECTQFLFNRSGDPQAFRSDR